MTAGELSDFLGHARQMLASAGLPPAKLAELDGFRAGLDRFADRPLKEVNSILATVLADGTFPSKSPRAPRASKVAAPKPDAGAVADDARRLYERAAAGYAPEELAGLIGQFGPLTKPELLRVAEAVQLRGLGSKSKGAIGDAIRSRIEERRGQTLRREANYRHDDVPAGAAP